jgi:endonuclease III
MSDASKPLSALLKRLNSSHADAARALCGDSERAPSSLDPAEPLVALLVRSMLHWDAPSSRALGAMRRIEASLVDFNELRVCQADELHALLGDRYPKAFDRSTSLRSVLGAIYAKHHSVSLEAISKLSKAKASEYLYDLAGMPPFVAARMMLLGFGAHAAPVDERILCILREARVIEPDATTEQAGRVLERTLSAGELPACYALLQCAADELPEAARTGARSHSGSGAAPVAGHGSARKCPGPGDAGT